VVLPGRTPRVIRERRNFGNEVARRPDGER